MGGQSLSVAFQKGRRAKAELVAQDFEVGLGADQGESAGAHRGRSRQRVTPVERSEEVVLLGAETTARAVRHRQVRHVRR